MREVDGATISPQDPRYVDPKLKPRLHINQYSLPMNSAYWIGIVQGTESGIGGLHWQVQLRGHQVPPKAIGTAPGTDGEMILEPYYPVLNAMIDGRMVLGINVMYGTRINASQFKAADRILDQAYRSGARNMGMWNPLTNTCRVAAVKAYSTTLREIGAMTAEAATIRHDWWDRATRTIRYQADAENWTMTAFAALMNAFAGWSTGVRGGSMDP